MICIPSISRCMAWARETAAARSAAVLDGSSEFSTLRAASLSVERESN